MRASSSAAWLVLAAILPSPALPLSAPRAAPPALLSSLSVGEPLRACGVCVHRRKLFVTVPVVREAAGGGLQRVRAYLDLPPWHEYLTDPNSAVGQRLTVYVRNVQTASGRLEVDLGPNHARAPRPAGRRPRRAGAAAAEGALRLEDLAVGDRVTATVRSVHPKHGAFVECGVSRAGRRGARLSVDGLLPPDQSADLAAPPAVGQTLALRVLAPSPASGRLLLTARPLDAEALGALNAARIARRARARRRPGLGSLAAKPGAEREGSVVAVRPFGVLVNVGARRPGLVHVSQLATDRKGAKGGFVEDPSEVCEVGDRVSVKVLPQSTPTRLSLRLLRVFPRDAAERAEQRALLRWGQTLTPRYARAEDGSGAGGAGGGAAASDLATSAEMDAAWAAREWGAEPPAEEAEEEDPWAWAAAEAAAEEAEEEDPWAAAAAEAPAAEADGADRSSGTAAASGNDDVVVVDDDDDDDDAPKFEDDYFDEKYDVDYY